ncbi:hypothetical protein [Neolewinella sp.]|uniref:hypothetical protein n=1 Tax=Neolewinella sp. TaxID=2993543 RepID=UPI003B51E617
MTPPLTFLRIFWLYGRTYWLVTALMTGTVGYRYWQFGTPLLLTLVYFKLFTTALFAYLNYQRRQRVATFYQNFGLHPSWLTGYAAVIDLLLCAVLILLLW